MFRQPKPSDYDVFSGNNNAMDHFSEILVPGPSLLVEARNMVYKLDIEDLKLKQQLPWTATKYEREICLVKGKNKDSCQNYIKVLKKYDDDSIYENDGGRYLICGTNAYKPKCREYEDIADTFVMSKEISGIGKCPYDPDHSSTLLLDGDNVYAGTVTDFSGSDPIVYRDPLRTPQYDPTFLNIPSFVGSFADEEFVYFFFREDDVEYFKSGKAVLRVARVCKNDRGGTNRWRNKFSSFLKSRLNCNAGNDYPFSFDEIQDVSELIEGEYGSQEDKVIYTVMTNHNFARSLGRIVVSAQSPGTELVYG